MTVETHAKHIEWAQNTCAWIRQGGEADTFVEFFI